MAPPSHPHGPLPAGGWVWLELALRGNGPCVWWPTELFAARASGPLCVPSTVCRGPHPALKRLQVTAQALCTLGPSKEPEFLRMAQRRTPQRHRNSVTELLRVKEMSWSPSPESYKWSISRKYNRPSGMPPATEREKN